MSPNVGTVDRIIRIVAGLALLAFFFVGTGTKHWFGLIGVIPLATAFINWCPAYTLLGLNTHRSKKA